MVSDNEGTQKYSVTEQAASSEKNIEAGILSSDDENRAAQADHSVQVEDAEVEESDTQKSSALNFTSGAQKMSRKERDLLEHDH